MIIFLYGEDTYCSREKLKSLKEKYLREVDTAGSSLTVLDGENIAMESINEAVGASSLFARKRMIVVERLFSNKNKTILDQVYEFFKLKAEDDGNIIIFWDDISGAKLKKNKLFLFLSKLKYTQVFASLTNIEINSWIKKEVEKRGSSIKQQAIITLASIFGNDLWSLNNEINKLINYKGKEKAVIEAEDVANLERGKTEENIFALTDAISQKNKAQALKLLEDEIEAGVADTYLMHMVIRQFRILMQVREGLDDGLTSRKITNQLKLHPFVVSKSLNQARNFTLPFLKSVFNRLVEVDKELKTGQAEIKTILSLMITKI